MNNLDVVFKNYFPDEEDYDSLFHQFYEWLNDDEKNMMFAPIGDHSMWLDLCNNKALDITEVCEYWCSLKLNLLDGTEGFVINDKDIKL